MNPGTLDRTMMALSDPTRRAILKRLSRGEARVTELAQPFEMSLNAVSKHIIILERACLVRRRRQGREHYLSANPEPLSDAADWIDHYRRLWEESLDRLDEYLRRIQSTERNHGEERERTHGEEKEKKRRGIVENDGRGTTEKKERRPMEAKSNRVSAQQEREIVITRILEAPRELVFKAWTDPQHLIHWWAPKGCTTPFCKVDLRPGGKFHFCMRLVDGRDIWGIGIFREIAAPERIVYTDSFADAEGNPVPPTHYGMSAGHPQESLVTVVFAELKGKTRVTLRHSIPEPVEEREATQQGWSEMLDRLVDHLMKVSANAAPSPKRR